MVRYSIVCAEMVSLQELLGAKISVFRSIVEDSCTNLWASFRTLLENFCTGFNMWLSGFFPAGSIDSWFYASTAVECVTVSFRRGSESECDG